MTSSDQTQLLRPVSMPGDRYVKPSRARMLTLLSAAREADGKAREASTRYDTLAEQAESYASTSQRRGSEARRLAIRFARRGVPEIADAGNQYTFWKGEQERICAMIAAEHALWQMYEGER